MSLDMTDFLNDVKRASMEAVSASKPFSFVLGEVTSISPLKVKIDQKLELANKQLILTNAVRDFSVYMTVDHQTENADGHTHAYKGKKKFKVHFALKVGEKVLMLRTDGGQKFIILDRVEALK